MNPEIIIRIDSQACAVKPVQLVAPDTKSQPVNFRAYQAIAEEVETFSERVTKLLRLERACGEL